MNLLRSWYFLSWFVEHFAHGGMFIYSLK